MRRWTVPVSIVAILTLAGVLAAPSYAQDLPQPPVGFKPPPAPPPAPVKPYNPVAVTLAGPFADPSFAAFRKSLAALVEHKDRAGLAKLIVSRNFFWLQDQNIADNSKAGIDNLAKAIALDNANGAGWDILASDADDPTLAEVPQNPGLYCAPAPPSFDVQAFQKLFEQTQTEPTDWAYPARNGVEARAAAQPDAQVVDKLGLYFVRVLQDTPAGDDDAPSFVHVALPNGKTGFVDVDDIVPLAGDQICYAKEAGAWKIAGYIGGASQ